MGIRLFIVICFIYLLSPLHAQIKIGSPVKKKAFHYLALGDSYTIGESVARDATFPAHLSQILEKSHDLEVATRIIATTGWTTTDLLDALRSEKLDAKYDLVTLLIGVNNQYQAKDFKVYEKEFPELLAKAIEYAGGRVNRVIVVSIPDYAYTPFGQTKKDPGKISEELDDYNAYAKLMATEREAQFVNITDITRNGLKQEHLVAEDQLHPSSDAYRLFAQRLLSRVRIR